MYLQEETELSEIKVGTDLIRYAKQLYGQLKNTVVEGNFKTPK